MKKIYAILLLSFISITAQANLITLELDELQYNIGDQAQLDISVTADKSIAEYAFELAFDNLALRFISLEFGTGLDLGDGELGSWKNHFYNDVDRLYVDELSWFDNATLQANHSARALLASITFEVIDMTTTGEFGFNLISLTDTDDNWLASNTQVTSAPLSVVNVPEPPSLLLFGFLLLFIMAKQRKFT